jgi:hypothetical protein
MRVGVPGSVKPDDYQRKEKYYPVPVRDEVRHQPKCREANQVKAKGQEEEALPGIAIV